MFLLRSSAVEGTQSFELDFLLPENETNQDESDLQVKNIGIQSWLTFAMCVITFGSNNEKSENYHRLIEMTGPTIIGDELVDPFSTGCCDLPENSKI